MCKRIETQMTTTNRTDDGDNAYVAFIMYQYYIIHLFYILLYYGLNIKTRGS